MGARLGTDEHGGDDAQPGPSGRDSQGIPRCGTGWRGGETAAHGTVNAFTAAERLGVVYGGDGAQVGRCFWNGAGHGSRLAAAVRFVARGTAQASQGGKAFLRRMRFQASKSRPVAPQYGSPKKSGRLAAFRGLCGFVRWKSFPGCFAKSSYAHKRIGEAGPAPLSAWRFDAALRPRQRAGI